MKILIYIKWLLSCGAKSIVSFSRVVFYSRNTAISNLLPTNSDLIVIGNGPSLNDTLSKNSKFFLNKSLIAVNHFANTDHFEKLKPEFYIAIAHDLYYEDVEPNFLEASNTLFKSMAEKTAWEMVLFMPFEARKYNRWQQILSTNENISIKYINLTPANGFKCISNWLFKINKAMPRPHNVMIPSLILGINMGFETIHLVGADHSWLKDISVNDNNEALINHKRFYDNDSKPEAFDKKGRGARTLHEILFTLMTAFKSYHIINSYAEKRNVKILNCTEGSFIDAFERNKINYE